MRTSFINVMLTTPKPLKVKNVNIHGVEYLAACAANCVGFRGEGYLYHYANHPVSDISTSNFHDQLRVWLVDRSSFMAPRNKRWEPWSQHAIRKICGAFYLVAHMKLVVFFGVTLAFFYLVASLFKLNLTIWSSGEFASHHQTWTE
jgi:hypothetical protein